MGRGAQGAADLAALVGKAYESALAPSPFADVLPDIIAAFGADAALISLYAPELGRGDIPVAHKLPAEAMRRYREHFWAIDPWRIEYQRRGIVGAATGDELVPFNAFEKTEIYNDQLRRNGFFDTCCGEIFRSGTAGAAISILRARRRPFFARRDVARLNRILPHLAGAFALRRRFAQLAAEGQALAAVIDRSHAGILLCDGLGRVDYASERARRVLDAGDVLYLARNRLHARAPAAERALSQLFVRANGHASPAAAHQQVAAAGRSGRAGLRLTIIRALAATVLDARGAGFAYYVLLDELQQPAEDAAARAAARYRFTPAEARLAGLLAGGATLTSAAETLGVSVNTVRSQLQQIFQKTGVARQAELMRLLLRRGDAG